MPLFAIPWAFAGLAAAAGLAGVYWLRNRSRRRPVSALFLWDEQRRATQGGQLLQSIQTPLLFFLELLAILLLVLGATDPRVRITPVRHVVVVLDDSYSMQAEDGAVRAAAVEAIESLFAHTATEARLVLAGKEPRLLGPAVRSAAAARAQLQSWAPHGVAVSLPKAIVLADSLAGPDGRVLVLTDQPPNPSPDTGRLEWRAVGRPRANLAITNAIRTGLDPPRLLLEVSNLSEEPVASTLTLQYADQRRRQQPLTIPARDRTLLVMAIPPDAGPIIASLPDDALAIDNRVTLLPSRDRPVRVDVRIADARIHHDFTTALQATGLANLDAAAPELIVTDAAAPSEEAWVLQVLVPDKEESRCYAGPFILDRTHPLLEGVSLEGVIWAGQPRAVLPGRPIVSVADALLLSADARLAGPVRLHMQYHPEWSNLSQQPVLPIVLLNLLQWRQGESIDAVSANQRLGWPVTLRLGRESKHVTLTDPAGEETELTPRQGLVTFRGDRVGLYRLRYDDHSRLYAFDALDRTESDLTPAREGHWGRWDETGLYRRQYSSLAYLLVLTAAVVLLGHQLLLWRQGGRGRA
jgi:hypothetical protein